LKLQQAQNLQLNSKIKENSSEKKSNVAFNGAVDMLAQQGLRFLDTNQAWGANFVDVAFMVTPRSVVDFSRGPDAGFETMRRESSGTVNHSLLGAYGLGAAYLLSRGFNKDFGVSAHNMFTSDEKIDTFGKIYHEELKANPDKALDGVLSKFVDGLQGFNPERKTDDGWVSVKLTPESKENVIKVLKEEIQKPVVKLKWYDFKGRMEIKKAYKVKKAYLRAIIATEVGAEKDFRFKDPSVVLKEGAKIETSSLDELIDGGVKLFKTFTKSKVKDAFTKATNIADNAFLKGLKKLNLKTSLVGLGVAAFIGCNIQPMNMYLTKKKTGKSGFVGSGEGGGVDKSSQFKLLKIGAAGIFGAMVMATIGNPSKLLSKLQFKGFTPTLNQFKTVYGLTIMSRFLVARDKNELREATTKDTLGFLNWIVLGSFVSKLTAMGFQKFSSLKDNTFIRYNEAEHGKGWWNRLTKSNIITRDEVLFEALKKAGISTIKDGKALSYKEMLKIAVERGLEAKTKVKYLNIAQLVGYVYSGVVLGIGVPRLNIGITKSLEKKRKEKRLALEKANHPQSTSNVTQLKTNETPTAANDIQPKPAAFAGFNVVR